MCMKKAEGEQSVKLERIKCKPLERAWDISVSSTLIIGCTGSRAVVLNRQYQHLQTIDGLDHVYKAHISPDEKRALLVSTKNKFYVADLVSGEKRQVLIRAPFHNNLEGRGCWSNDGKHVYIPVVHSGSLNSTLRCYRIDLLTAEAEFLQDKYIISFLLPLTQEEGCRMICRDRNTGENCFVDMKDGQCTVRTMDEGRFLLNCYGCRLDEKHGGMWLGTQEEYRCYDGSGRIRERIRNPFPSGDAYRDMINQYAVSFCGKYAFMATNAGFYVTDAAMKQLLVHIPEKYGIHHFEQLEEDVVAAATMHGVRIYRMFQQKQAIG